MCFHLTTGGRGALNKNNIGKIGMSGKKHSVESIEKMRQAKIGKYKGEPTVIKPKHFKKKEENYVHPNKGRTRSEETKAKMRIAKIKKQDHENLTMEDLTICL